MKWLCLVFFVILFVACQNKGNRQTEKNMATVNQKGISANQLGCIDFSREYPSKEFYIQDLGEVEYIPLETSKKVLWGGDDRIRVSDSLIVVYNDESTFYIFNRKGKCLSHFNRKGKSGEEYIYIDDFTVDFKQEELFVTDIYRANRILVYDFKGNYKRVLSLASGLGQKIMDYDPEYLLGCNIDLVQKSDTTNGNRPYYLISKKDGTLHFLDIVLENPVSSDVVQRLASGGVQKWTIDARPMVKNGDRIILSDWSLDTIYAFDKGVLHPLLVKTLSVGTMDPCWIPYVTLKSKRYTFISAYERPNGIPQTGIVFTRDLVYDHNTGEIYKYSFVNNDYADHLEISIKTLTGELPKNYGMNSLSAFRLVKAYKEGKLQGKLKEVASRLDEEDNPVLMLVKFKEE